MILQKNNGRSNLLQTSIQKPNKQYILIFRSKIALENKIVSNWARAQTLSRVLFLFFASQPKWSLLYQLIDARNWIFSLRSISYASQYYVIA